MQSRPTRLILAAFLLATPAAARAQPASAVQDLRLTYGLYAHGFRVLAITADLRLTPQTYSVAVRDHTTGFLGFMLRTDVTSTATGRFVPGGVLPLHFRSSGYSRGAHRDTVLEYTNGNPEVRVLTPQEPNRDPVPIEQARGSIDTLAAMAELVHQVQATGHCDGSALIFDGLRLSRARATTAGTQALPQDDRSPYRGSALRCDFTSLEIGGFLHNHDEARMRKPHAGSAWVLEVLPGAPALPVRIVFDHPTLGLATMVLTGVEPGPPGPNG